MLRQVHQARERRLRLAAPTAQYRNEAVQRRAFMPIEFAQIDLLDLPAAWAEHVENMNRATTATPTIGDQPGLCRAALRSINLFHRVTDASARFAASAYFSASPISRSMSLSDGRMPMLGRVRPSR